MELATENTEILIGTVDDCFQITGRGCVMVFNYNESANFSANSKFKLITPEKEIVITQIKGIEMIRFDPKLRRDENKIGVLLEKTKRNNQKYVKETEVYLLKEDYEQTNT